MVTAVASDEPVGCAVLTGDGWQCTSPAVQSMVDSKLAAGLSDTQVLAFYGDWSNGYVQTGSIDDDTLADGELDSNNFHRLFPDWPVVKTDEGVVGDVRARHLHHWWTRGEGLKEWADKPHPWTALYHGLLPYIKNPEKARKTAARWFKDATGMWPGERKGVNPVGPG